VLKAGSGLAADDRTLNTLRIASKLLATNHLTRESAEDGGKYVEKHYLDADVLCGLYEIRPAMEELKLYIIDLGPFRQ
jgi:hypothetical protein